MAADAVSVPVRTRLRTRPSSRYRSSKFYPTLGGMYGRFPFNADTFGVAESDPLLTITSGDEMQWTNLGLRTQGSGFMWWVIALVNDVRDPLRGDGMRIGDKLVMPAAARIQSILRIS